ncbi:MAG TPA: helix-hairpin-helix domain-containing protein [Actinomycetota bacterium]|jgi:competence protein ComEA|nr:helix-hairpin-helix domain-containing protein [Actinomycetota bacterium]
MDDVPVPKQLPGGRALIGLAVLAAVGLVGGYGVAMRAKPKPTKVSLSAPAAKERGKTRTIYVHVGGAVRRPGLYRLEDGARVDDAVRAAGGVLEDADLDALNLAARVKDGDKILVPAEGQGEGGGSAPPGSQAAGQQGSLVNLNTASLSDLETLPGIGPALAQRILDFREKNGGFRTVEDLLEVPGIGSKKFEELRDLVTV